ncbi:helix-turn-helix domain-containing protein [Streptomyces apocyni]|uniref:helix-turn-helix domain-containing protein n=1 Tax=Streptomyces apocyni TaxID=2654677 RepID=UPI0012EA7CC1|nr:helix-turn-helix transcriptional regulator [Streptomyces apocyni]
MPARKQIDPSESLEMFLGKMVERARIAKGWTRQKDLADAVRVAPSRISQIECGAEAPNVALAEFLDDVLGTGTYITDLARMIARKAIRDYAQLFVDRQLTAHAVHQFAPIVPGLMQTRAYARALMLATDPSNSDVDDALRLRIERQEAVTRESSPVWLSAVIDEAGLRRTMGDAEAHREQLRHLLALSQRDNVLIQVLPFTAPSPTGMLTLLDLPDSPRCAYAEAAFTGRLYEEPADVARMQHTYDHLSSEALSRQGSRDLIRKILDSYEENHQ